MDGVDTSVGHPFRGVSVSHMETEFLEQVRAAGLTESAKIYEIEPLVIRPRGEHLTCPRSGLMGAAYVDAIHGRDRAGMSQYMLSYTWGYSAEDIVGALADHCRLLGKDGKETYVWICCLCINQHRVKEAERAGQAVPFDEFCAEFGNRVKGIGHVLALMTPWHSPTYVTRVWCIFELFTAANEGHSCQLTVLMPPGQTKLLCGALVSGALSSRLWAALEEVRVQNAQASVHADRENIMRAIEAGMGCERINYVVRQRLLQWFAEASATEAHSLLTDGTLQGERAAAVCVEVSSLLRRLGQLDRAFALLAEARCATEQSRGDDPGMESCEGANLLRTMGLLCADRGDEDGAMSAYNKAIAVLRRIGQLESHDGAAVLTCVASSQEMLGNPNGALQGFREAWLVRQAIGADRTLDGADLLAMMGSAECHTGLFTEGIQHLEEGRDLMEALRCLETPHGARVLEQLGTGRRLAGDHQAAIRDLEESHRILVCCGVSETPAAANLLRQMGRCQGLCGNRQEELRLYREARLVLEQNCKLCTKQGAMLLLDFGSALLDNSKKEEACEVFELARDICDKLGLLQTEMGQLVLKRLRVAQHSQSCSIS